MTDKKLAPLPNNKAKMDYAMKQSNILRGFSLSPDHSVLKCEGYIHEKNGYTEKQVHMLKIFHLA